MLKCWKPRGMQGVSAIKRVHTTSVTLRLLYLSTAPTVRTVVWLNTESDTRTSYNPKTHMQTFLLFASYSAVEYYFQKLTDCALLSGKVLFENAHWAPLSNRPPKRSHANDFYLVWQATKRQTEIKPLFGWTRRYPVWNTVKLSFYEHSPSDTAETHKPMSTIPFKPIRCRTPPKPLQ